MVIRSDMPASGPARAAGTTGAAGITDAADPTAIPERRLLQAIA
jgi:hypothetical protein